MSLNFLLGLDVHIAGTLEEWSVEVFYGKFPRVEIRWLSVRGRTHCISLDVRGALLSFEFHGAPVSCPARSFLTRDVLAPSGAKGVLL